MTTEPRDLAMALISAPDTDHDKVLDAILALRLAVERAGYKAGWPEAFAAIARAAKS